MAKMAGQNDVRFKLLEDEDILDIVDAADSKNTKNAIKYSVKIFEDYLNAVQMDITRLDTLSNLELDSLLQKFYAGARQKNGSLYSKKSMSSIRFGLQRHFLNTRKIRHSEAQ